MAPPPLLSFFNFTGDNVDAMNAGGGGSGYTPPSPGYTPATTPDILKSKPWMNVIKKPVPDTQQPKMPWETMEGFNKMLEGTDFQKNLGLANTIFKGVDSAASLTLGIWQMFQAQQMNEEAKKFAYSNFQNTAQAANQNYSDKYLQAKGDTAENRAIVASRALKTTPTL